MAIDIPDRAGRPAVRQPGAPDARHPGAPTARPGPTRRHAVGTWAAGAVGLPVVVGGAAALVTVTGSWIPSLWGDEAATVLSATRPLPSLWAQTQHLDAVHAAYYLLMHYWIAAFGASALSVRFPSALAVGAAAAGLVTLLHMFGRRPAFAVLAAALYVSLPRIQYIGQEARSFALDSALVTWTLVVFVAVVQGRLRRRPGWALYALCAAVATYLSLFSAEALAIAGLTLAVSARGRRLLSTWATWSLAAVAVAAPVLAMGYAQRGQVGYLAVSAVSPSSVVVATWFGNGAFALVAWALIVIAVGSVIRRAARARARGGARADGPAVGPSALMLTWAFLPPVLLLATNPVLHLFAERYVASCTPAVAVLMAEGVRVLWVGRGRWARMRPGLIALACVVAVAVPAGLHQRTPYSESGSDWAAVGAYVHRNAQPGSDVLFAETVSPSKRARNGLRLYPDDYRGLHDVALTVPWFDTATTWYDRALTIRQAVEDRRVTAVDVWVVETVGSGDEGMAQLRDAGYRVVRHRHFDIDTVYELQR